MSTTPVPPPGYKLEIAGDLPRLKDVPEFEKPIASTLRLAQGSMKDAIAHVDWDDNRNIYVDNPDLLTDASLAHEVVHQIQALPGVKARYVNPEAMGERAYRAYDYGGIEGLKKMLAEGKTIADLNDEQQAAIIGDYVAQKRQFADTINNVNVNQDVVERQFDEMNKVYAPFIRQLAHMARPAAKGIDTSPPVPGAPPSYLTGELVSPPEVGGEAIYAEKYGTPESLASFISAYGRKLLQERMRLPKGYKLESHHAPAKR